MFGISKIRVLPVVLAVGAGFCAGGSGMAQEVMMAVEENSIRSLTNSPAILAASAKVDEAGRPSLMLNLQFANDCVAETGVEAKYVEGLDAITHVIVERRPHPGGCPDIFNPVEKNVRVLLPSSMHVENPVYLIGRPVSGTSLPRVEFRQNGQPSSPSDLIVEARRFSGDDEVPRFELQEIRVHENGRGYTVSGLMTAGDECVGQFGATLYEAPNEDGEPLSDIIIITAPASCQADGHTTPISLEVNTPQPASGRGLFVINTGQGEAIPLMPG